MTSDKLDEIPRQRAEQFAALLREPEIASSFPLLGEPGDLIVQRAIRPGGATTINLFNPVDAAQSFDPACLGSPGPALEIPPHGSMIL